MIAARMHDQTIADGRREELEEGFRESRTLQVGLPSHGTE